MIRWSKLFTRELLEVIAWMAAKKTVEELEEESEIIKARIELAQSNFACNAQMKELRIESGAIAAAIERKK